MSGEGLIFVVGSGRSGTTVYQNYLDSYSNIATFPRLAAAVPALTGLAAAFRRLPQAPQRLVRPSSESQRLLEEVGLSPSHEQKLGRRLSSEDAESLDPDALRRRARTLRAVSGSPIVVLKNTMNSARVEALAAAFPESVFHHIYRHPARVIESLLKVAFWGDMALWWDGRTVAQYTNEEKVDQATCAARHWAKQVTVCLDGLSKIADTRSAAIEYASFTRAPEVTTRRALTQVGVTNPGDKKGNIEVRDERLEHPAPTVALAVENECVEVMARLGMLE